MADRIFAAVEAFEAAQPVPWGPVLDAGTGVHSLRWLLGTPAESVTAITASTSLADEVRAQLDAVALAAKARLVLGNWSDPSLLAGERFAVVLVDYLLGALDAYQPYGQALLFPRLREVLAPGGRVYVVGLEPSPARASEPWGELILATERLRDAAILLAGDRCYREYPRAWVAAALERAGLEVEATQRFPIRYGVQHVTRQLGVARRKLPRIDPPLAAALAARADRLEQEAGALAAARGVFGEDYLVVARAPQA